MFALLVALFVCAAVVSFLIRKPAGEVPARQAAPLYDGEELSPYSSLMQNNEHYQKATNLLNSRKYSDAREEYKLALVDASNDTERAQISFDLANATDRAGDPIAAIQLYKQIITNDANIPILRAYAVQNLGRMYRATRDPRVTTEIFKDAPFASMRVDNNDDRSYRRLFEYGSSLYPLGLLELYIANSYITEATANHFSGEALKQVVTLAQQKFANADKEVARMSLSPNNELHLISEVLNNKAITLDKLKAIDQSVTAQRVESAYIQTMNAYATAGASFGDDFYTRISYAGFLAREYGEKRASDIASLLSPLPTLKDQLKTREAYLINARNNPAQRANLVLLGQLDESFRSLLISLGWHDEDFAR